MRPRVHNLLSYFVTLIVFWAVLSVRAHGAGFSTNASLGAALWTTHFSKRTLESAFLHRYGKPSVGAGDYLTEYLYYWGFAAWIAWSLAAPGHRAPPFGVQAAGLVVFVLAELGNLRAHLVLRSLRSPGGREKRIPRGFLFEWVSCPHYACEIASWAGFNLVTGTLGGVLFMCVGAVILSAWAHARHVAYQREFDAANGLEGYPPKRRALVPGLF